MIDTIVPANSSIAPEIVGQIVGFTGQKTIHKISLDMVLHKYSDSVDTIREVDGVVSFQAANFQESRDDWAFQPQIHWLGPTTWETSGTTLNNAFQPRNYTSSLDAVSSAPYVQYNILFQTAGIYDFWGYAYSPDGIYWSWSGDSTDLRLSTFPYSSARPHWTKFGSISVEEGGMYSFTVYLNNTNMTLLDQWYLTTNDEALADTPVSLSEAPFNTAVRIRSLNDIGGVDSLQSPSSNSISVTAWSPSANLLDSGKMNYYIRNRDGFGVAFDGGCSIEFWQIGGSIQNFVSWRYSFVDNSIGSSFRSNDFGQNFT